jgi:hypothetical protein
MHTSVLLEYVTNLPNTFLKSINITLHYITYSVGTEKTKLRGRSPHANYTDRTTAACRRI